MGKIFAAEKRVVSFTSNDLKTMTRHSFGLSREQAEACATAVAAARHAHGMCGPGLAAVTAIMAAIPKELATKWAKNLLAGA